MHMHVDYEQYEVTKMVEDPGVRNQLQSTSDKRKQQEILINDTQERIRQYKEEQVWLKFGWVLKSGASRNDPLLHSMIWSKSNKE